MKTPLLIFTLLCWLNGFSQKIVGYSADSLVRFEVYENGGSTGTLNFADSCIIRVEGQSLPVYSFTGACVEQTGCDSLIDELWTRCQLFRIPRFVRCVRLDDQRYALIGYTTDHPIQIMHLWVLSTAGKPRITDRIGIICLRTLSNGLRFRYAPDTEEVILNVQDMEVIDEHIYRFGACFYTREGVRWCEQLQTDYSIWVSPADAEHLSTKREEEVCIRLQAGEPVSD